MDGMKRMRVRGPSASPPYRIRWSFDIIGRAQEACDRVTQFRLYVPANDTDRFPW
jgi:hypothetical protein